MQNEPNETTPTSNFSRRQFLKRTSLAAATAAGAGLVSSTGCAHKAAQPSAPAKAVATPASKPAPALVLTKKFPINAVIIGLGGRGSGAGRDFMDACKVLNVQGKIVAVADMFPEKAATAKDNFGVPDDKCFSGFDAYKKALEVPGVNYAILATPPGFRPPYFKACIEAGKNVFMEKPVAVDGPGIRVIYAAHDEANKKNLKVAAGTQRRHRPSYIETINRVHQGAIGDIGSLRVYWVNGGPIWHRGDQGATDLERQIRNWYHYIWLCGDHICEQHVHNLDIANWIMKAHPVKCWGMGARQQLDGKSGEIWDNFAVEYQYANGVRLSAYCGQVKREWSAVSEAAQGSKGTVEMHDGRNLIRFKDGTTWKPTDIKDDNGYVNEHRDLIAAILNDTPLNEAKQVADTTLTAIMGREAAYSGSEIEWDTVFNSTFSYGPEALLQDPSKMEFTAFRTLQPPMPGSHNILKNPPEVPVVKA